MINRGKSLRIFACCLALGLCAASGLAGCSPEGTGSVKGTPERPPDGALGRPLGNAPELPKKKPAREGTKKDVIEPANPRL
jgi:hypothetical protein